jgi:hypothetical protein
VFGPEGLARAERAEAHVEGETVALLDREHEIDLVADVEVGLVELGVEVAVEQGVGVLDQPVVVVDEVERARLEQRDADATV